MNVPELRFPEFEGEWEEKKFSSVCTIEMGQSPSSKNYTENSEDIVLIQGNADLKQGKVIPRIYTTQITKTSNPGDIILTVRAPVGDIAVNDYFACIGRGVCSIKGDKFIYHLLGYLNEKNIWKKLSQGSTFEAISSSDIKNLNINIPFKMEQEKIASFLSAVDEKIEKLEKKLELWEAYKKGMMQKIFSQELRFKDENGEDYPEWEEKKLSEIAECLDNMRKPLNSNDRLKMQGDIPYYGANGIVDYVNDYIFDEPLVLLAEDGGNFEDFQNKPIAQLIFGKSWVNNHAHILRNRSEITINFLFYSLVHKDIRKYINGTSRSKLNKKDMLSILLNLPNLIEQDKIIKILSVTDEKINLIKQEIKLNNKFKKGLLQKMFC